MFPIWKAMDGRTRGHRYLKPLWFSIDHQRTPFIAVLAWALLLSGASSALGQAVNTKTKASQTKSATARPSPKAKEPTSISLPEARVGQMYEAILDVVLPGIPYGRAQCSFDAMPDWLTFDPTRFTFSGIPTESKTTTYLMTLSISSIDPASANNTPVQVRLDLPVKAGPQIAYANPQQKENLPPPVKPSGHGTIANQSSSAQLIVANTSEAVLSPSPQGPPASQTPESRPNPGRSSGGTAPSKIKYLQLSVTSPQREGEGTIVAKLEGLPEGLSAPNLEVWAVVGQTKPFQLQLKNPAGNNLATVPFATLDVNSQTYTVQLQSPLAAGQKYLIYLSSPAGQRLALCTSGSEECGDRVLAGVIQLRNDIRVVKVHVDGTVTAGNTSINGWVEGIADPAISANDSNSVPGNLPLIRVLVRESAKGGWNPVSLQNNLSAVQVGKDGRFSLTLQNALVNGEKVRLEAIPPAGHVWEENASNPQSESITVFQGVAMVKPSLSSKLGDKVTDLSGSATSSQQNTGSFYIGVERIPPLEKRNLPSRCVSLEDIGGESGVNLEVLKVSSSTATTVQTTANGTFNLTLDTPLAEGEKFRLVQVLPADAVPVPGESEHCFSEVYEVPPQATWGRVNADFTAGILVSNNNQLASSDTGSFSQAHQFLDLTLEKAWRLPSCYLSAKNENGELCWNSSGKWVPESKLRWPGLDTTFEARLTAIPVSTVTASGSQAQSGGASSSPSFNLSSNQLTQAQTARLGIQVYLPFLATRWSYHRQPYALFLAPMAKIGFDTLTGSSSVTVTPGTPGANTSGASTTLTLEQLYNFRGYGVRFGQYSMTNSTRRAPSTVNFLDVTFGPYSNLESLHCGRTPAIVTTSGTTTSYSQVSGYPAPTSFADSTCLAEYPAFYGAVVPPNIVNGNGSEVYRPWETRQRLYRLDFEGLLNIPSTWLYVGFNANLGQKVVGGSNLDRGYAAPDDLRFLFGTRFNIGDLLSKLGVSPF